jgi:dTDP-4-dehydrorhamnose 3,5-epimerase-like enzyme
MRLISVPVFSSDKGSLAAIDNILPFDIKKVLCIYGVRPNIERGGHGHKKTRQGLMCVNGSCKVSIYVLGSGTETEVILDNPTKCLILEPEDWHTMTDFTEGAMLLVFGSEHYSDDDYIYDIF